MRDAIELDAMGTDLSNSPESKEDKELPVATLVLGAPSARNRQGWLRDLSAGFAVCEVAERRALQQVVLNLKPDILIVDLEMLASADFADCARSGDRVARHGSLRCRLLPRTKKAFLC